MNTTLTRGVTLAAVLAISAGSVAADDKKSAPSPAELAKLAAKAATPGPAHARLKPLAGQWTYTCKLWTDPTKPPVETKGTIVRRWILGGRFLTEKVSGTGLDGAPKGFEGFGLYGYDNVLKKYSHTFACTMGTGTSTGEGVASKSGFTFKSHCSCPFEQRTVTGRDEIRIVNRDKVVMTSYATVGDKPVKVMELVTIRQKK